MNLHLLVYSHCLIFCVLWWLSCKPAQDKTACQCHWNWNWMYSWRYSIENCPISIAYTLKELSWHIVCCILLAVVSETMHRLMSETFLRKRHGNYSEGKRRNEKKIWGKKGRIYQPIRYVVSDIPRHETTCELGRILLWIVRLIFTIWQLLMAGDVWMQVQRLCGWCRVTVLRYLCQCRCHQDTWSSRLSTRTEYWPTSSYPRNLRASWRRHWWSDITWVLLVKQRGPQKP